MQTLAYGLYDDRVAADAAIEALERLGLADVRIVVHVDDLPNEEIRGPGTRSRAYALIAAAVAAVVGGITGGVLLSSVFGFGAVGSAVVVAIGAAILGALVGGLAGSAIPRREVEGLAAEVRGGKVLVGANAGSRRVAEELLAQLNRSGAIRTGLIGGTGIGSSAGSP